MVGRGLSGDLDLGMGHKYTRTLVRPTQGGLCISHQVTSNLSLVPPV